MENDRLKKICTGRVTMPAIAVLVNLMWGSAVIFIKKGYAAFEIAAGSTFDELLFASVRFLLAGVMILAVCRLTHQDLRLHRAWIPGILQVGLFQTTLQYLFYYIGVSHTPASISSILVSTSAFIVVLLSPLFFRGERLAGRALLGCAVGFAGVLTAVGFSGQASFTPTGEGFLLISSSMASLSAIFTRKNAQGIPPLPLTGHSMLWGGGIILAIALAGGGKLHAAGAAGIGCLVYLAFISAVTYTLWCLLLKYNQAGRICIYNLLIPVFGILLSALLLGENAFQLRILAALALVCAGIAIVNLTPKKGTADERDL